MAEDIEGYGYVDDESEISSGGGSALSFGLNAGIQLSKFEWIPNGGKDGAEQEALDIVFTINGKEVSDRKFPVTRAYGENNVEITDASSPEMKQARTNLNAILSHLMGCFVPKDALITALSVPVTSFKQYCTILMGLLPKDFSTIKLDLFAQYQWQIKGEANRTYLRIPDKMKYGKFLCASVPPVGVWKENRLKDPQDNVSQALFYTDDAGNLHSFTRNGWFVNSAFSNQQKEDQGGGQDVGNAAMSPQAGTPPVATAKGW